METYKTYIASEVSLLFRLNKTFDRDFRLLFGQIALRIFICVRETIIRKNMNEEFHLNSGRFFIELYDA